MIISKEFFNKACRLAVLVASIFWLWAMPALSAQCPTQYARNTPIWKKFDAFVKKEYGLPSRAKNATSLAYGHALGRLAIALDEQPNRKKAYACVELALEQIYASAKLQVALFGVDLSNLQGVNMYLFMREAAMASHDAEVLAATGVSNSSPLYQVFGVQQKPSPKPIPGPRTLPLPAAKNIAAPAPKPARAYINKQCIKAANWSLTKAQSYFVSARRKVTAFQDKYGADGLCTGDGWYDCKAIADDLWKARDQIFQVFDQNHDSINQCRQCNYDQAIAAASPLTQWEKWLSTRSYGSASAMGNMADTITGHKNDATCMANRPTPNGTHLLVAGDPIDAHAPLSTGGLLKGYYAVETAGAGYSRRWDVELSRQLDKELHIDIGGKNIRYDAGDYTEYKSGRHIKIIYVWPPKDGKPRKTFSELTAEWTQKEAKAKDRYCHDAQDVCRCYKGKCPCGVDPDIWVDGPKYTLLGGPYEDLDEIKNAYQCNQIYPDRNYSNDKFVCINWTIKRRPYPEVLNFCAK